MTSHLIPNKAKDLTLAPEALQELGAFLPISALASYTLLSYSIPVTLASCFSTMSKHTLIHQVFVHLEHSFPIHSVLPHFLQDPMSLSQGGLS